MLQGSKNDARPSPSNLKVLEEVAAAKGDAMTAGMKPEPPLKGSEPLPPPRSGSCSSSCGSEELLEGVQALTHSGSVTVTHTGLFGPASAACHTIHSAAAAEGPTAARKAHLSNEWAGRGLEAISLLLLLLLLPLLLPPAPPYHEAQQRSQDDRRSCPAHSAAHDEPGA
jgi:hypothetical protein